METSSHCVDRITREYKYVTGKGMSTSYRVLVVRWQSPTGLRTKAVDRALAPVTVQEQSDRAKFQQSVTTFHAGCS